jgi:hypothetical protein
MRRGGRWDESFPPALAKKKKEKKKEANLTGRNNP